MSDTDEALKLAIVAAVYAGDIARARALLDVLVDVDPRRQKFSLAPEQRCNGTGPLSRW